MSPQHDLSQAPHLRCLSLLVRDSRKAFLIMGFDIVKCSIGFLRTAKFLEM